MQVGDVWFLTPGDPEGPSEAATEERECSVLLGGDCHSHGFRRKVHFLSNRRAAAVSETKGYHGVVRECFQRVVP